MNLTPIRMYTRKSFIKTEKYIYKTNGVCPPEIHFQISNGLLTHLRFVGGGCPGNAHLVSLLLKDRNINDILPLTTGIECRHGTSCPDQLASAIRAAQNGQLLPAASFHLAEDSLSRSCIGVIGELGGKAQHLEAVVTAMQKAGVEAIICMGNITSKSNENRQTLKALRKLNVQAILGQNDWAYANGEEKSHFPSMDQQTRDDLLQLPQAFTFYAGGKKGLAFFGDYIQVLPGYSDYEPYALEMNMVCGLTMFMQDEMVFPALEAMTPQFDADIILFSQSGTWGHWQVGGKHFISIGPLRQEGQLSYGLLHASAGKLTFSKIQMKEAP